MEYISYSQYSSYTRCPRSWYLSKVRKAEEKQTWYIPIGSAVHTAVEMYLKGQEHDLTEIFYELISRQMSIEPDTSKWLFGGAAENPIVEDKALDRANECYYNALTFLEDVEVYEIEYDASGTLPGLDIPIKGFIDIIGKHKKHGEVIIDWKTGSSKPKDNFQLETYKALLMQTEYNKEPYHYDVGLWGMLAPGASKARPVDLSLVSPKDVGAKYQAVYEKMERKLYQTNAGYNCRFCFNQENCKLEAGPTDRAKFYDRAEEDGYPF
jgi:putative RecB family exonuclease